MLSFLKGHENIKQLLTFVLISSPKLEEIYQNRLFIVTFDFLNEMISLLLTSDIYYEPMNLLLNLLKHETLHQPETIEAYIIFLHQNQLNLNFKSLEILFNSISSLSAEMKKATSVVQSGVLIAKTIGSRMVNLSQWDIKSAEIFLDIVKQLIQIVRSSCSDEKNIDTLCRECNNVKRHVIIKLTGDFQKIFEIVGKQYTISKKLIERFASLIEYVLSNVIDGLKCSSKIHFSNSVLVFIYNMIVVWKFIGKIFYNHEIFHKIIFSMFFNLS